jgi:hypothetical protein
MRAWKEEEEGEEEERRMVVVDVEEGVCVVLCFE